MGGWFVERSGIWAFELLGINKKGNNEDKKNIPLRHPIHRGGDERAGDGKNQRG